MFSLFLYIHIPEPKSTTGRILSSFFFILIYVHNTRTCASWLLNSGSPFPVKAFREMLNSTYIKVISLLPGFRLVTKLTAPSRNSCGRIHVDDEAQMVCATFSRAEPGRAAYLPSDTVSSPLITPRPGKGGIRVPRRDSPVLVRTSMVSVPDFSLSSKFLCWYINRFNLIQMNPLLEQWALYP